MVLQGFEMVGHAFAMFLQCFLHLLFSSNCRLGQMLSNHFWGVTAGANRFVKPLLQKPGWIVSDRNSSVISPPSCVSSKFIEGFP
mgnify:CR=1 FL=1